MKVHSVSGIYGDHLEPQCQKWCILPLSGKIWGFQDTTTLLKKNDNSCDIDNASF